MNQTDFVSALSDDIRKRLESLPSGNSFFQEWFFNIVSKGVPARAYKALVTQIKSNLNGLRQKYYAAQELQLQIENLEDDIAEILEAVEQHQGTDRDLRRLNRQVLSYKLQLEEKKTTLLDLDLSIKHQLSSIQFLRSLLEEIPQFKKGFTRDEFEAQEYEYYKRNALRQINQLEGAKQDLINMETGETIFLKYLEDSTLITQATEAELLGVYTKGSSLDQHTLAGTKTVVANLLLSSVES